MRRRWGGTARGEAGFTLVELLIAMTLVGLIMALLGGGIFLGARTWEAIDRKATRISETRQALEFLRRYLTAARGMTHRLPDGETPLFWGNREMLEWVAPLPAYVGHGGLSIMRLSADGEPDHLQLVFERWFFHPQVLNADAGSAAAWIPMTPTNGVHDVDAGIYGRHVLIEHLEELDLEYFGALDGDKSPQWHDKWANGKAFPRLVRVRLRQIGEDWPAMVVELSDPAFRVRR